MRRGLLRLEAHSFLWFGLIILLCAELGYSQEKEISKYPSRPITLIFPYSAGANTDLAFRLISKEAEKFLGQPIVVINKVGGGATIGTAALAVAKPDGYTIGQTGGSQMFVTPFLEQVPYNPVNDFRQIMQFMCFNIGVVVRSDSPFKSFHDLVTYARENPKKLTYGTSGAKNMIVFILEQIAKKEKIQITNIPFKSVPEAEMALLGGHILCAAGDVTASLMEAKKTRLLLLLREEHSAEYPEAPILKDLGYDLPFPMYTSIAAPSGVPDGIIKKLEEAFSRATKEPTFISGMKELRLGILYRNSKDTEEYVKRNYIFFGKLIKEMEVAR